MTRIFAAVFAVFAVVSTATAQVKLKGTFQATRNCVALQSIKKATNPGDVSVTAGTAYRLLGKNNDTPSHFWIEVPKARPLQRWVALDCGTIDAGVAEAGNGGGGAVDTPNGTVKPKAKPKGPKDGEAFYVLALSWQPAFCETMQSKKECKTQTPDRHDARNFSIHGLWPQPRRNVFCGVDRATAALDDQHQWEMLPAPQLTAETKAALDVVMPGTQSLLERHEWIKHGTCYGDGNAETYFRDSLRLTQEVNGSVVQRFMAENIGKKIQTSDLRKKFDEAFGQGAGSRVRVACSKDGLISELTIGLKGDVSSGTKMADLIAASSPTDPGCPVGMVDAVN